MSNLAGEWTRSSFCADYHCVEVAMADGRVFVRDGKHLDLPHLQFSRSDWGELCAALIANEFAFD